MRILEFIGKIMILVVIAMVVAFIFSILFKFNFRIVLEYIGVIFMAIGGLSLLGSRQSFKDMNYNLTKLGSGVKDSAKKDLELAFGSYTFCVFMGATGLILLLVSLVIFYL